MRCPSCGHENRTDRLFCAECGTALGLRCSTCGARNEPGEKFCGVCGVSLTGVAATTASGSAGPPMPSSFASGRYAVKGFLGEGGRKKVYLAHDSRLSRDVAIALIKTEGLDDAGLARVRREARAMGGLGDHPHIVTVHDIGEEAGQTFIVSQFMAGGSVADLLEKTEGHRLPLDEALRIAGQVSLALEHAHAREIVHRDLKPGNVWLTENGTAKLGDFGLAVALDRSHLTTEGMMIGTVAYMPPEQATGREADARSDLYSLGAMLYEMLTGRPPFLGDDTVSIISQHLNTPPITPSWHNPSVPPGLDALIMQLLAKVPEERPASATAVRERLHRIASAPQDDVQAAPQPVTGIAKLAWGRFVGRQQELATLRAAVESSLSGQGSLSLIAGNPGVGKSRLAEEAGVYARLRGAQVLTGRCYEGEGAPAFWPWVQVIRSYVYERDPKSLLSEMGPGAADIAQVVTEVRERLPGLPSPPSLEPEQARFRLFDSVTSFLKNAAKTQPLVLILDDLHWADKASLLLLQFLAREMRGVRLLVIGTYQDVAVGPRHPLAEVLGELWRERPYERIHLKGFSEHEVTALLEAMAQQDLDQRAQALAASLHRATEGNPFFIQEIIRHLVESGRIYHLEGKWTSDVAHIDELGIAEGIREVIGRRIGQLSEECNRVLTLASVLGREFAVEALERVAGLPIERLWEVLEEAAAAQVITEVAGTFGVYRFSQAMVRETLYGELGTSKRVRVHRQVALALEELYAQSPEPHLAELAHHFMESSQGGEVDKAVDYSQRAARRAMGQLAYEEAARHYERALRAAERMRTMEEPDRCELLLALGDAQWRAGENDHAADDFKRAAEIARDLKDSERFARAALGLGMGLGGFGFQARADDTLIALLSEALDVLPVEDGMLRMRVLSRLAAELYYTDRHDMRVTLSGEAMQMADRLGDPRAQLIALYSRQVALLGPDGLEERLEAADKILPLAAEVGDKEMEFRGRYVRLLTLAELADIESVDAEIEACARLAGELRQPFYLCLTGMFRSVRAMIDGRLDEALSLGEEASRLHPSEFSRLMLASELFYHRWAVGPLEEVETTSVVLADSYPWIPTLRAGLAFLHSELGREPEARAQFEILAAGDFSSIPRDGTWLLCLGFLAHTCTFLRDTERAAVLYDLLYPYRDRFVTAPVPMGPVTTILAMLASVMGRWDESFASFEQGLETDERIRGKPLIVQAMREYARALTFRGAPGDREKAVGLLNEALDGARTIGMNRMTATILALKLRIQGVGSDEIMTSIDSVATAVAQERPDLRRHAAPDGTVTMMFTDIENYTAMNERLGDVRMQQILRAHTGIVNAHVSAHGGYIVKSQGDGFMIAFSSARSGLRCAAALQNAFRVENANKDIELNVRMGLHTGEAIHEADDFFGKNVILAARIAAAASGGEVLVSSLVKELTESGGDITFGERREVELKGLSGTHSVFPVEC